jgi:hypothetical protein
MQLRIGLILCVLTAFSQTFFFIMQTIFPYVLAGCAGVFLSIYMIYAIKRTDCHVSNEFLCYFMAYQVASIWGIWYWYTIAYNLLHILLQSLFLVVASCGVYFSRELTNSI